MNNIIFYKKYIGQFIDGNTFKILKEPTRNVSFSFPFDFVADEKRLKLYKNYYITKK